MVEQTLFHKLLIGNISFILQIMKFMMVKFRVYKV